MFISKLYSYCFAVYNYASKNTVLSNDFLYPIQFHPLAANNLLYTYESQFGVVETMACIEQTLKNMGIPVFTKFDHGKNAQDVMATEYGLDKEPVIGKMQKLLEKIVIQSASVY